jgi:hypothetical protein
MRFINAGWEEVRQQIEKTMMVISGVTERAFSGVSEAITNAVVDGKNVLWELADVARNVAKDILNNFIRLSVSNPLQNMLFGQVEGYTPKQELGGAAASGVINWIKSAIVGAATGQGSGMSKWNGGNSLLQKAFDATSMPTMGSGIAPSPGFSIPGKNSLSSALGSNFLPTFASEALKSDAIPKFATGTNYVPRDMLAQIHKGEAVIPASQNKPGMMGNNVSISVNVNGGGGAQVTQSEGSANAFARGLQEAVVNEIQKQQRPGGLLARR